MTKSTLYQAIRKNIGSNEDSTRSLLKKLVDYSDSFSKLKNKSNLNWPKINLSETWAENVAEMNLLGYTIHLPCFLYALKNNENILGKLSELSLNLLFRWVTICDYGVSEIDSLFKKVLYDMQHQKTDQEILSNFIPLVDKVQDSFVDSFTSFETESSIILKYISCKIELKTVGKTMIPDFLEVDLEHILPKNIDKWDNSGMMDNITKPYSRWINSVGNVILLEKGKNRKLKDNLFKDKRDVYASSGFSQAQKISMLDVWHEKCIHKNAVELSELAQEIWKLSPEMCKL